MIIGREEPQIKTAFLTLLKISVQCKTCMERNKINAVPDGKFYNFEAIASNAPVKVFLAHALGSSPVAQITFLPLLTGQISTVFKKAKRGLTTTTFF